mgnify:CR=1 FL=1
MTYDMIIRNGRWFDGTGGPSALRNIGIRDGRIAVWDDAFSWLERAETAGQS